MKLSVIILAKNEAEMIGECIDSVKSLNAYEILVIDDGSADDTISIAQHKGATVITHNKKNFAEAREFAMHKAKGDWLFYIDADERLSTQLADEMKNVISNNSPVISGYCVRRVNYYLGRRWPKEETIARLFQKIKLKGWFGEVHETAKVDGTLGVLKAPLYHYTHCNLSEMVANTGVWSEVEAKLRFDAKHPHVVWWRILRVMGTTFFDYYFTQGGWKVGTVGIIESMYQSFSMFVTYARLWELQNK